ncbi:unnamed protein product, partial [Rotaria sp. Silwood1]
MIVKHFLYYENYTNSIKNTKIRNILSIESLLIADVWETLLRTINCMLSSTNKTHDKFQVFRQGKFYNGLTP